MKAEKKVIKIELKDTPNIEKSLSQIYEDLIQSIEKLKNLGKRKAKITVMIK